MWTLLDERLWFPDPRRALSLGSYNGLVAIGGDLSVERLLLAYRSGIFPWTVDPISWWSPEPRGIIELNQFHVSRSLGRVLRQGRFRVTLDQAFRQVMEACGAPVPDRPKTWISPEFIDAYGQLHDLGHAHSVEVWLEDRLVGGVYGVQIGAFFAGESMFHRVNDASKVALFHLVQHLQAHQFELFDIQIVSPHTRALGAVEISREQYLRRLAHAVNTPRSF